MKINNHENALKKLFNEKLSFLERVIVQQKTVDNNLKQNPTQANLITFKIF